MIRRIVKVTVTARIGPGGAEWCSQGREPLVLRAVYLPKPREGRHRSSLFSRIVSPLTGLSILRDTPPGADAPGYNMSPLRGLTARDAELWRRTPTAYELRPRPRASSGRSLAAC